MKVLTFQAKDLRAEVIAEYMMTAGYRSAVCFSCGYASEALYKRIPDLIAVAPTGQLQTQRWWTMDQIHHCWPERFDATPGHLPAPLMVRLAAVYKKHLGVLAESEYIVPTGSGETILCLRIAYPNVKFTAEYNQQFKAVKYEPEAPLNAWVAALFPVVRR